MQWCYKCRGRSTMTWACGKKCLNKTRPLIKETSALEETWARIHWVGLICLLLPMMMMVWRGIEKEQPDRGFMVVATWWLTGCWSNEGESVWIPFPIQYSAMVNKDIQLNDSVSVWSGLWLVVRALEKLLALKCSIATETDETCFVDSSKSPTKVGVTWKNESLEWRRQEGETRRISWIITLHCKVVLGHK